jgi:hypothetical protein
VTAPARPWAAGDARDSAHKAWQCAADIRDEWLTHGLSTEDADRAATEQSLSNIYRRLHRPSPRFVWADSPAAALAHVRGVPTHDELARWIRGRRPPGQRPLASDLAAAVSRLRSALELTFEAPPFDRPPAKRKKGTDWPVLPPEVAIDAGIPFAVVLRQSVRDVTWARLAKGLAWPVRVALAGGRALPVHWYGQHDAAWIAHLDVIRRLGLARFPRSDDLQFEDWATLARSCGWWWPGETTCVVVERPATVRPTVTYRDGYTPAAELGGWRGADRAG